MASYGPIRVRLTEEQKRTRRFLQTTHSLVPVRKKDLSSLKFPLAVAVVPFPKGESPQCLTYPLSKATICKSCHAYANNRYIPCPDGTGWLCPVCGLRNPYIIGNAILSTSIQTKTGIWDGFCEEVDAWNVATRPLYHCLVLELTEVMIDNGFYNAVLEQFEKVVSTVESGFFTVFVFNTSLYIPIIVGNGFSIARVTDMENPAFPNRQSVFFDVRKDRELLLKYIQELKIMKAATAQVSVLQLIKGLDLLLLPGRIPAVIVGCQMHIESSDKCREFASVKAFKAISHFEIWEVQTDKFPPDYSGLSELAQYINTKVHYCSPIEINVVPALIVDSLFDEKVSNATLYCVIPECFKLVEVLGSGYWKSDRLYCLTNITANDAIYFVLDYDTTELQRAQLCVQIQMRFTDHHHRRVLRVMTTHFSLANNINSCSVNACYDVVIGTMIHQAFDRFKEFGTIEAFRTRIDELKKGYLEEVTARLFLLSNEKNVYNRVNFSFARAKAMIDEKTLAELVGKNPIDISYFLAPVCYSLVLSAPSEIPKPVALSPSEIKAGAYYIRLPWGRGVVYLCPGQSVDQWSEALRVPPLSEVLQVITEEHVIEILTEASFAHTLFQHIHKCLS